MLPCAPREEVNSAANEPLDKSLRRVLLYCTSTGERNKVKGTKMYEGLNVHFNSAFNLAFSRPAKVLGHNYANQLVDFLIAREEKETRPFNRVLDLSDVQEVTLSSAEIHRYVKARLEATASLPPFCTAIIAPNTQVLSLALLYSALMRDSQIEVKIFDDAASAAKWLQVPISALNGPISHSVTATASDDRHQHTSQPR